MSKVLRFNLVFYLLIQLLFSSNAARAQQLEAQYIEGSRVPNAFPVNGTVGQSWRNHPESLADHCLWVVDDNGTETVFLFGGRTYTGTANDINFNNRLWKYTEAAGWELLGGDSFNCDAAGVPNGQTTISSYGSLRTASASNWPTPRMGAAYDVASNGDLFFYGGYGLDENGTVGTLADLWMYDISLGQWLHYYGAKTANQALSVSGEYPGGLFKPALMVDFAELNGYQIHSMKFFGGGKSVYSDGDFWVNNINNTYNLSWIVNFGGSPSVSYLAGDDNPAAAGGGCPLSPSDRNGMAYARKGVDHYILGGFKEDPSLSQGSSLNGYAHLDFWRYNASSCWVQLSAPQNFGYSGSAGNSLFEMNGSIYFYGANVYDNGSGEFKNLQTLQRYDDASDTWEQVRGDIHLIGGGDFANANLLSAKGPFGEYSGEVWPKNAGYAFAACSNGTTMYLYGGQRDFDNPEIYSGFYKFNGTEWALISDAGITSTYIYNNPTLPVTNPGNRVDASGAYDAVNDRYFLFGGYMETNVNGSRVLQRTDDFWVYENETWILLSGVNSGANAERNGSYGTLGQASASNYPGSRHSAMTWVDQNGDFWMFGGYGRDATSASRSYLNDLWRFDYSLKQWVWEAGSSANSFAGDANNPSARFGGAVWSVGSDAYVFGGRTFPLSPGKYLNDLWKWDGTSWSLVSGSSTVNSHSDYSSGSPYPGGRYYSAVSQNENKVYLYGGTGVNSSSNLTSLDELWQCDLSSGSPVWSFLSGTTQIASFSDPDPVYEVNGEVKPTLNAAGLNPGGIERGFSWADETGVYVFGGLSSSNNWSNALWHWDGNNWAFLKGDQTTNMANKGLQYSSSISEADLSNLPAGRYRGLYWKSNDGAFHLYAGSGTADYTPANTINSWLGDHWVLKKGAVFSDFSSQFDDALSTASSNTSVQILSSNSINANTLKAKDFLIDANYTTNLDGKALEISGSVYNYGGWTGNANLLFNGGDTHYLLGEAVATAGLVEVESGDVLETQDSLIIKAESATVHGQLINSGTVNGEIEFQYWLDLSPGTNNGRYFHFGSVLNGPTINDFNAGGFIQTGQAISSQNTVWQWDASNCVWNSPASLTDPASGVYSIFAGNSTYGDFLLSDGTTPGSISIRGTYPNVPSSEVLNYNNGQNSGVNFAGGTVEAATEGWNFVYNPFTFTINAENLVSGVSGLNNAIYAWDGSVYATYINGVVVNSSSQYLAPGQGFWVQTNSSQGATVNWDKQLLRAEGQNAGRFKSDANASDGLRIALVDSINNFSDDIWLGFNESATQGFDGNFDAWKLNSNTPGPQIAFPLGDGSELAISIIHPDSTQVVPLLLKGNYISGETLSLSFDLRNLNSFHTVILEDHLLDQAQYLSIDSSYQFIWNPEYMDRFQLRFDGGVSIDELFGSESKDRIFYYQKDNASYLQVSDENGFSGQVYIYNMAGVLLEEFSWGQSSKREILMNQPKGVYMVKVSSDQNNKFSQLLKVMRF
mgnify:CR=1 FL=1